MPAADATLRKLLAENPDNGAAWSDLGFVLEQQSHLSEAIKAFEKAAQIFPEDRDVLQHAGLVSHDAAIEKAQREFDQFAAARAELPSPIEAEFEHAARKVETLARRRPRPKAKP